MLRRALLAAALAVPAPAGASPKASYQHYLKAVLHANQGQYAEALREYEEALELDPQSSFMHQQAAELALEAGMTEKALALARRFSELSPREAQAFLLLGNVRWARGELREAQAAFERALALQPGLREALFSLGNLLGSQSPGKAKKYLEDYLATNPDNAAEAQYQLALIEQRAGRNREAAAHLEAARRRDPANLQTLLALAQVYEVAQDTAAALDTYLQIREREPRNTALHARIGEIYFSRGEADKARESFLKAKELAPANPAACLWLALMSEQEGDFSAAADHLRSSAALKEEAAANLRLSYYLTQAGRLQEAVAVLEDARTRWPKSDDVAYFLALGYDDLKQPRKAAPLLREVVERRPTHRDARFQLGAIMEKVGDMAGSEIQFREILRSNPDDASALNYLGYSLADRGLKLEDAERMTRRAAELQPKNGAYMDSWGWTLFKRGRLAEARERLEAASALMPEDPTVWDHRGEAYRALGDLVAAWSAWRRALTIEPSPAARAKLERVERQLGKEELGGLYLRALAEERGRLAGFGGPCAITGEVGGRKFSFAGLLHYRASGELSIEVLGPMFAPLFKVSVSGGDGFTMDPLRLEGVDERALQGHLQGALRLVRDYLAGAMFDRSPARLRGGWKGPRVEAGSDVLFLDKGTGRLARVRREGAGSQLKLSGARLIDGHALPAEFVLEGAGFRFAIALSEPQARFE